MAMASSTVYTTLNDANITTKTLAFCDSRSSNLW